MEISEINPVAIKEQVKNNKISASQKIRCVPAAATQANKAAFKAPILNKQAQLSPGVTTTHTPKHNPKAENALVMRRPRYPPKAKQIVDVVVDPLLTAHLRKHQREGVAFMYECVMGMKNYQGEGAILADEMGLGKTLQTIALLWTLMKQNPIGGDPPVVRKALIVCPVTLIKNWRSEFKKWLGRDRVGVFVLEDKKSRLTDFTKGKIYSVMIVGYEKLRMVQNELAQAHEIDIVVADEGHRLKTAQNKSAQAIKSLSTERRIILSGTPLQNDLSEFYTMVDFVNPNVLGKYSTFKKEFEGAILKGQQPGASVEDREKGEARGEELKDKTDQFVLRRTAELLSEYLPSKTEYIVFCRPTEAQISIYRHVIQSAIFNAALGSPAVSLELINILKKVCNSPALLLKKGDNAEGTTRSELLQSVPSAFLQSKTSSKLHVLGTLLHHIRSTTNEKVVLVSNYTSTMDILANLLTSRSYKYLRLDGTTPQNKRQDLVERFNRSTPINSFVFLLSAKAGGTGLNLIGASRLVLFDIDWNPATDLQAMARVHRDGQKKPCYIYRLLTQGALDEKIFQRQASKTGLADSIVDGKASVSGFSQAELRDLFTLDESEDCQTHRLLGCRCGGNGMPMGLDDDHADLSEPRNDLAALTRGHGNDDQAVFDEDGVEVIDLKDDDATAAYTSGDFRSAKDYNLQAENAAVPQGRGEPNKMLSLMRYAHFNTACIKNEYPYLECIFRGGADEDEDVPPSDPLEGVVEDGILRAGLREKNNAVGFIFSKLNS
jgi:DNA repair and recombination protein RAD54B